jgi:hypothetical protein
MAFDLKVLVDSLPLKKEQRRLQEFEERRQQILKRFANDTLLSNTKDPRKLNSIEQCIYIVRCLELGLKKDQIVDLFFEDEFIFDTMTMILGINVN